LVAISYLTPGFSLGGTIQSCNGFSHGKKNRTWLKPLQLPAEIPRLKPGVI